jgi:hypothetical protein
MAFQWSDGYIKRIFDAINPDELYKAGDKVELLVDFPAISNVKIPSGTILELCHSIFCDSPDSLIVDSYVAFRHEGAPFGMLHVSVKNIRPKVDATPRPCDCPRDVVINYGCRCGGI